MGRIVIAVLCLCTGIGVSGCQVGRMAASINSDTLVPSLQVQMVPKQWEPELDDDEDDEDFDAEEADITDNQTPDERRVNKNSHPMQAGP